MKNNSIWTDKTVEYARIAESKCDMFFNILTGTTSIFKSIEKNSENYPIDYNFITKKGSEGVAELKIRYININTYNSIFIEPAKLQHLQDEYLKGNLALYINWMFDYKHVWILNIKKTIEFADKIYDDKVHIHTADTNADYDDVRKLIPIDFGHYYELDEQQNKYIKIW